eukprot:COSAG06_NODE_55692_length_288_cov_1.063492_1_plen_22_part_10
MPAGTLYWARPYIPGETNRVFG